jgi:uncharacterized protein (TIGR03437 family)
VYLTGVGALTPAIADGSIGLLIPPFPAPIQSISANIGGASSILVTAPVLFTGQAPGLIAGVTQVNVRIPQNAPTGASVPITITAGEFPSQPVGMAVQ